MYVHYNANPDGKQNGDCVIRAISKAIDEDWDKVYAAIALQGYVMYDMPSSNAVWGAYLKRLGFKQRRMPDTCPDCYKLSDFAADHKRGTYIVAMNGHVVCVHNGNWYDTWDCGNETPIYFFERGGITK